MKIYVATGNMDKFREIRDILNEHGVEADALGTKGLEVQGSSNEEIAYLSAMLLSKMFGKPLIVEDSGLYIEALNGFPGPYSSYVYKTVGVMGIIKIMKGVSNRRAYFLSAVAYAEGPMKIKVFTGKVEGTIAREPRGGGWGFDPIFIPEGYGETFGELGKRKNLISHRRRALEKLVEWLKPT